MSDLIPISNHTLRAVQSISGMTFSTFLTLHLANQWTAPLGSLWYDEVMALLRKVYQNKFVEPVLIFGSIGVHMAASGILIYRRTNKTVHRDEKEVEQSPSPKVSIPLHLKLHRLSGYILPGRR